ncbi:trypsin-like peptidase domain-containing protein [Candidatus Woesearchaeota archaeon]|nr:trypsin-like peptidase domain-containing protein [Candidatus Woesearchaeota archaeon]
MARKSPKNLIFAILSVLILIGGITYYFNYSIRMVKQDYEAKISNLNRQTAENLMNIETQINALGLNLSSQIGSVGADLNSFKQENQHEIITLSNLIDQIEQQSSIKLSELKSELKDIQIKSADFSAIVDDVLQSVVSVKTNVGQGSGAIIDRNGYIVTNVHVINGASTIKVVTYSGDSYNANTLVGYNEAADIAVLKVSASSLNSLDFGDSDEVKVGEKVIAAGNPAGLSFTVTEGIVSAFRDSSNGIRYIQTDVPINPGNSGGPLINAKGEIIGINNFKVGGFEGLGFAISSNDVRSVVKKMISDYESKQNP